MQVWVGLHCAEEDIIVYFVQSTLSKHITIKTFNLSLYSVECIRQIQYYYNIIIMSNEDIKI